MVGIVGPVTLVLEDEVAREGVWRGLVVGHHTVAVAHVASEVALENVSIRVAQDALALAEDEAELALIAVARGVVNLANLLADPENLDEVGGAKRQRHNPS